MNRAGLAVAAVLLIAAAAVRGQDDDMKEMIEMLHTTCVGNTGVAEDLIQRARKGDFAEDKTLGCYMKCLFTETSAMSDDGVLDAEALIAMLPDKAKDAGTKIIMACKDATGADACEIALNMHKCTYKENPAMYFLP